MKYHFLHGRQQQLFKLFPNPFTLLALQCLQWCTVNHLVLYFTWSQIRANNGRGYFPSHIVVSNFLRTFFLFFFFTFSQSFQIIHVFSCIASGLFIQVLFLCLPEIFNLVVSHMHRIGKPQRSDFVYCINHCRPTDRLFLH